MIRLLDNQIVLLRLLRDYRDEKRKRITYREVAAAVGLSASLTQYHLERLADYGFIAFNRSGRRARAGSMHITPAGLKHLAWLEQMPI